MVMLKPITTSVYTFRKLIEGGFLYVDKTELLWRLVEPASGVYFLSRPRRFGKSLTLSTFEEIFLGNREQDPRMRRGTEMASRHQDPRIGGAPANSEGPRLRGGCLGGVPTD